MTARALLKRCTFVVGRLVFALVAWLVLSQAAVAGCSHLVTARAERARSPANLAVGWAAKSLGERPSTGRASLSQSPASCRAAWCADFPAMPAAPMERLRFQFELWAWFPVAENVRHQIFSDAFAIVAELRPTHCAIPILRPPRRA